MSARCQQGNVTVEYVICLVFFVVVIGGLFVNGSIVQQFQEAYNLFFDRYGSTVVNMDAIP